MKVERYYPLYAGNGKWSVARKSLWGTDKIVETGLDLDTAIRKCKSRNERLN